jgi:hypothetical protein
VGLDCWNPDSRNQQVIWYRNGLANGPHILKVLARGTGNPLARGRKIFIEGVQWSNATGGVDFGEGGGPTETQRLVFGYPGREDLKDSMGGLWRPGTEFIVRLGAMADSVVSSWWCVPEPKLIAATRDPALYRHGVHARDFTVNLTVGPGTYHVRLKFAAGRGLDTLQNCVTVFLNGREIVKRMDVAATAGGPYRAVDLVFNDVAPRNGVIDLRFLGGDPEHGVIGEAFVQAIEVRPGPGPSGAVPVTLLERNLLRDGGFEKTFPQVSAVSPGRPGVWEIQGTGPGAPRVIRESVSPPTLGGLPEPGAGKEALRIAGRGHSRVVQEIVARPRSLYRGSAWVCARDLDGRGFGHSPGDSAGLLLEELDAAGKVVAAHPKSAVTRAGPFRYLSTQITAGPKTARIRLVLDTVLECNPEQGSITYDQCALEGPPGPASVFGQIVDFRGKPLLGSLVTGGGQAVRTGSDGGFILPGLSDRLNVLVQAEKQGHYPNKKELVLEAGANRCDLVLEALPTNNLLRNGNFEEGFAQARSVEHGPTGVRGPWSFQFAPGVLCYIYPESIYTWRKPHIFRGKEAISMVTDGNGELKLYQDVSVDAKTELTASAWVQGLDVGGTGKGFGAGAKDFAGLWIQELDSQGRVLVDHRKVGLNKATSNFERMRYTFRTGAQTAKVRFILYSNIRCIWQQGAAIFDECALEKTG